MQGGRETVGNAVMEAEVGEWGPGQSHPVEDGSRAG